MNTKIMGAIALAALAGSAIASNNVLVWSTGNWGMTQGVADYLQASGQFDSVTALEQDTGVSLATLNAYDKVLYFSNASDSQDPNEIGNTLADFADTGKRLVLTTFSWANQGGNTLGGRIINDGISPFTINGSSFYTNVVIGSTDGSAFWTGVNSITGFFHDNVGVTSGATLRGTWSDGSPLLATKGNVVAINLFPDDSYGNVFGDHRQLFVNSLGGIPTPGTLGALSVLGLAALRRRR